MKAALLIIIIAVASAASAQQSEVFRFGNKSACTANVSVTCSDNSIQQNVVGTNQSWVDVCPVGEAIVSAKVYFGGSVDPNYYVDSGGSQALIPYNCGAQTITLSDFNIYPNGETRFGTY